jgi:transcription elongation GreA/GreB family factor
VDSPLGKALLGKVAGDMVNVVVDDRVVDEYKVLSF